MFFVLKKDIGNKEVSLPEDATIKNAISVCLENSLQSTILTNAFQGGYYSPQKDYLVYSDDDLFFESKVPYYIINFQTIIPLKKDIEEQISLGVEEKFKDCVSYLEFDYNVSYDYENLKIDSLISNNAIQTNIIFPVKITYEKSSVLLKSFKSELDTPYFDLYNSAKKLTEDQLKNIRQICVSCIADFEENSKYNLYHQILINENSFILINTLQDTGQGILFNFAYKFDLEALEEK